MKSYWLELLKKPQNFLLNQQDKMMMIAWWSGCALCFSWQSWLKRWILFCRIWWGRLDSCLIILRSDSLPASFLASKTESLLLLGNIWRSLKSGWIKEWMIRMHAIMPSSWEEKCWEESEWVILTLLWWCSSFIIRVWNEDIHASSWEW